MAPQSSPKAFAEAPEASSLSPAFHKSLSETSSSGSEEAFLIFDAAELDIMGMSANFLDATGLDISDEAKFSDVVDFDVDFQRRLAKAIGKAGRQAANADLENPTPAQFRTQLQMRTRNGGVASSRWKFNVQKQHGKLIVQGILLKTVDRLRLRSPRSSGSRGVRRRLSEPLASLPETVGRSLPL